MPQNIIDTALELQRSDASLRRAVQSGHQANFFRILERKGIRLDDNAKQNGLWMAARSQMDTRRSLPSQIAKNEPEEGMGLGSLAGLALLPLSFLRTNQGILEEDPDYVNLVKKYEKEYQQRRDNAVGREPQRQDFNARGITREQGNQAYQRAQLAYEQRRAAHPLYNRQAEADHFFGSLDSRNQRLVYDRAQQTFVPNPHFDQDIESVHDRARREFEQKYNRRYQTYQRTSQAPFGPNHIGKDRALAYTRQRYDMHVHARVNALYAQEKLRNPNLSFNEFQARYAPVIQQQIMHPVAQAEWNRFSDVYKNKAAMPHYAGNFENHVTESINKVSLHQEGYNRALGQPISVHTPPPTVQIQPLPRPVPSPPPQQVFRPQQQERKQRSGGGGFSPKRLQNIKKFFKQAGEILKPIGNIFKDFIDWGLKNIPKFFEGIGKIFGFGSGGAAGGTAATAVTTATTTAGTAAAGGGIGAILSAVGLALFFLLPIIFFIVILIILFSNPNPPIYTQVACSEEPGQVDAKGIGLAIKSDFGIAIEINGDEITQQHQAYDNRVLVTTKRMYDDLCRLFGHQAGGKPIAHNNAQKGSGLLNVDNTFGNLFRGPQHQYDSTGALSAGQATNLINLWFSPSAEDAKTPCTAELQPIGGKKDMALWIYEPDQCSGNLDLNTLSFQLEFLLDRNLAKKLIDRVSLNPTNPVYNNFLSQVYKNGSSLLPNPDCQKKDPRECFADMVGDYTTWGGDWHNFSPSNISTGFPLGTNCNGSAVDCATYLIAATKSSKAKHIGDGSENFGDPSYLKGYAYFDRSDVQYFPDLPNNAKKDEIDYSVNTFPFMQCLNYVRAIAQATGHPFLATRGVASGFINNPPPGYQWVSINSQAQPGDIAVFGGGSGGAGHIAVVIQPNGMSSVTVSEGNGYGHGEVDRFTYAISKTHGGSLYLAGYLRVAPRAIH